VGAEERHVAEAIATNLMEMSRLRIPTVAVVVGEGGSGGALGIAVCDRVLMLENAYYSVISPEGCAAILWKDREKAPEAAACLKLSAEDLRRFHVVDDVIPEPLGGAHQSLAESVQWIQKVLKKHLREISEWSVEKRRGTRYQKYRSLGVFGETK
jgi:acetyl-CoA carboxylase carboxyl transferase subunit alpha